MSSAVKKIEHSQVVPKAHDEKTGDIPIAAMVTKLKDEQSSIEAEIDKAKAIAQTQAARQQDESTKIFNLRQAQMIQKIRDLEARKLRSEKELRAIEVQKNSKLHEDLKRATLVLVNETKKIAPLEKEIEAGVTQITTLKNEMQALFETSIDERKKNQGAFETQSRDIQALTDMVKTCTSLITGEFKKVKDEIDPLLKQKADLQLKLTQLQDDHSAAEVRARSMDTKLTEMDRMLSDKTEKLEALEKRASDLSEKEWKSRTLNEEIIDLTSRKESLQNSIIKAEAQLTELHHSGRRIEASLSFLHEQYERKKDHLSLLEKEVTDSRSQLDIVKKEEVNLIQSCAHYQSVLNHLMQEVSLLDSQKTIAIRLQDEAQKLFHEKREYYLRECKILEENYSLKQSQMESELSAKKAEWETGFNRYASEKEALLKDELYNIREEEQRDFSSRKSALLSGVHEILSRQIKRESFATPEQKSEEMGPELQKLFDDFFVTKTVRKKWWKFW